MKAKQVIGTIVRIIIGLVFMASAVTKYISIDAFDQFIYEHELFSWVVTSIVTRVLIAAEFSLGLLLIIGLYPKVIKFSVIGFLVFFSVYILLKPTLFNVEQDNCHCFGTVIMLSDNQTLIKNIILLALSYFMFWSKGITPKRHMLSCEDEPEKKKKSLIGWIKQNQAYTTGWICGVSLILSMLVIMPDSLQYKLNGKAAKLNEPLFYELIQHEMVEPLDLTHGKKILCMYSSSCQFCKRSAMRMDVMRKKYNISDDNLKVMFWGSKKQIDTFFADTQTKELPYVVVHPRAFLAATNGRQPIIVLLNDGKIEKVLKFHTITDNVIKDFINQ